jgi:hypothetical protein
MDVLEKGKKTGYYVSRPGQRKASYRIKVTSITY